MRFAVRHALLSATINGLMALVLMLALEFVWTGSLNALPLYAWASGIIAVLVFITRILKLRQRPED